MKTSYIIDQENRFPTSTSQASGGRSQSLGRPFNPSASLGIKSPNLLYPLSPNTFSQTLSPAPIKGNSCERQLEEAQSKITLLTSELDRVNRLNFELKKENDLLKTNATAGPDGDLSAKLAIILAENGKLNYALEKLREAYQREKLNNSRQNESGLQASMGLKSPELGPAKESNENRSGQKGENEEEYEKKIVTLYVQNDKLNDALEQKIKEVNILSTRLEEEQSRSLRTSIMSSVQSQFDPFSMSKKGEAKEGTISMATSQDMTGMVQALLNENTKLIEIVNRKDQEVQSARIDEPTKLQRKDLESTGEQGEGFDKLKSHLDEIINKNMTINKILGQQSKVMEDNKQNSTVDQFKAITSKLIEDNHKISQLVGESIHSLREEFLSALTSLPSGVNELKAKVTLLNEEKESLSNVLRDKLTEIGTLRQQIVQLQTEKSDTTDESIPRQRGSLEKDKEFQMLKNLVAELQNNSIAQNSYFKEFKTKLDGMGSEIGKLSSKKSKKVEDKESLGQVRKSHELVMSARTVLGDVANVEGQRTQENELKDFDSLKHHYADIKYCVSELMTASKKDDSLRSQVSSLLQENEKINHALREKEKAVEGLVNQLKRLEGGGQSKGSVSAEGIDMIMERFEEIRRTVSEVTEEGVEEARELKSNVSLVLSELTQLRKDFVNYHLELKMLKGAGSSQEQEKKAAVFEEERLRGMVQTLMREKEEIYSALRQKDSDFDAVKTQKHELNEKVIILTNENKNLCKLLEEKDHEIEYLHSQINEIQESHLQEREMMQSERQTMEITTPGEMASRTDIDASYSEESTPVKAQIKRRPLTEDEAIVQENFQGKLDIVFCVDCTRSMDPYIANARLACSKIISVMNQSKNNFPLDLKFGFVGYRDHGHFNGNTWVTKVQDLCDAESCVAFINKVDAYSSNDNDFPEAVMPALWDCAEKISWRDNSKEKVIRVVFHIADAPPHGKRFYKGKNDHYPKGDPSGIRTDQIAQKFADLGISYKVLKIGKFLDLMEKVFKQTFLDIECMELKKAEHLDQMTTAILVKQLEIVNSQISIKDKRFLNMRPKGNLKRTEKIGQCYFSSVLFDDYFEYFVEEGITEFKVRTLNLFYTKEALVGVQCVYVTKDEEIEAPARVAANTNARKVSLEFGPKEYLTEISGEVDQRENLCSLTLMTNMNKKIQVGGPGVRKFKLPTPPSGYILASVGGSFRSRGIDSLYFYYV